MTYHRRHIFGDKMKLDELKKKYERIVFEIETRFSDTDVPQAIQHYYLMSSLIVTRSFERFYKHFGEVFIDDYVAGIGKDEYLGLGMLDDFEVETILLWNKFCKEKQNAQISTRINY